MKYSQFNSVIPYQDKYALYNSFDNKVIFLEHDLKELLLAGKNENIDELEQIHPAFYKYLSENNFLVKNEIDEVEKVRKVSKKVDENNSFFHLTINPTMNCNFKCWYCYEDHIKASRLKNQMVERVNKFITKKLQDENLKHFTLAFFGGEPLLYFKRNVIPIIEHLKKESEVYDKTYNISFTTNGYLINQEFVDFFHDNDLSCNLQITLDGYREEHDKIRYVSKTKGSYFEIVDNIKLLIKNEFFVRLRINYTNENLENTFKIIDDFADVDMKNIENNLLIDYHRVWQNDQVDDLDLVLNRNMEIITSKGFKVTGSFSANNVLDSCYADKRNSAVINYNGDLYKCTARDFKKESRNGYIDVEGNLIWDDGYEEKRMNSKFNNKPCLSCRLMPVCNGGCTQHAIENLENDEGYCVYSFDDVQKDKVIYAKVRDILEAAV
ncbi:Radical_SAM domain-containing protein [Tenacibaculum sp. 190130A14a]|uniref:Radical_SAM domain-containing protein n=1 Tax=Tenacibaculum polynesiense TaxID=3137857 RepID=A0ABM9PDP6_9FLAO